MFLKILTLQCFSGPPNPGDMSNQVRIMLSPIRLVRRLLFCCRRLNGFSSVIPWIGSDYLQDQVWLQTALFVQVSVSIYRSLFWIRSQMLGLICPSLWAVPRLSEVSKIAEHSKEPYEVNLTWFPGALSAFPFTPSFAFQCFMHCHLCRADWSGLALTGLIKHDSAAAWPIFSLQFI